MSHERFACVRHHLHTDVGRHFAWRAAAPNIAETPSERARQGRGAAWRRADRRYSRAGSWPAHRRAKSSFETQNTQVKQITANLILLDSILAQYGPEALPIRQHMRKAVGPFADRLWREKQVATTGPFETDAVEEQVYSEIQKLAPNNDVQRSLHWHAAKISNDLAQARFMLFAESESRIPTPFLAILAFWLLIVFASYSLFSPLNVTLFTCLSLFAFSAASAIFLILELGRPFTGLMMLSSAPLRNALGTL